MGGTARAPIVAQYLLPHLATHGASENPALKLVAYLSIVSIDQRLVMRLHPALVDEGAMLQSLRVRLVLCLVLRSIRRLLVPLSFYVRRS
jgi:hypothetical protein